mgnify:CR=1 FL=1
MHGHRPFKPLGILFLFLCAMFAAAVPANADSGGQSLIVITDPIRIVDGGVVNDRNLAMMADSEGNLHFVFVRNGQHIYYAMRDSRGDLLIDATQLSNFGSHAAIHPDVVVDSEDRVHVVWADRSGQHAIRYTAIDPSLAAQNGGPSVDQELTLIDDTVISQRPQSRDWPAIDVDSQDNIHIVWEDQYDVLDKFFQHPQIYYHMLRPEFVRQRAEVMIKETLITPIIGHKGHPDIAVDRANNDLVQIVWDDTRGGKVEMVVPIDTSGSMYSEWADVCTVFYGGSWSSGGYFAGIKGLLENGNITVFETLYALGGYYPSAASSGACLKAPYHGSRQADVRTTPLTEDDPSGGLRKLAETVYNGNRHSGGYLGEDWGTGTTWACLSWFDAAGRMGGNANPPTTRDHRWNPNATKIVIPISDEGPYGGDPAQQQNDKQSIQEAHDACINAGIIPVPMYGGSQTGVVSHMYDLAQCPSGSVSTTNRNCAAPGTGSVSSQDAQGTVYEFPRGSGNQMQILVEAMIALATNNSREIYTTILDPYNKLQDPFFTEGSEAYTWQGGYGEDVGPANPAAGDYHLVVVNDTRITVNDAYSFHPSLAIDSEGYTHIAWMDARDWGFKLQDPYEIYYTKTKYAGKQPFDGVPGGMGTQTVWEVMPSPISVVEDLSQWDGRATYPSSYLPSLIVDNRDNVHISWVDNRNFTAGQEILYTKLNKTSTHGNFMSAEEAYDPWDISEITHWTSSKQGGYLSRRPDLGMPPALGQDAGTGAHLAWSDTNTCDLMTNSYLSTLCYTHILTGIVEVNLQEGENYIHIIEPSESTMFNMTVNNTTPGPSDLVADSYYLNISEDTLPENWTANLYFTSNGTRIMPDTEIYLGGGEAEAFYMLVRAPSIYQAQADEDAIITVTAMSLKDSAIRGELITITRMDVVHGIKLDTSHVVADIEQGGTAVFSISITNTGNVEDTFEFFDPTTYDGMLQWGIDFTWEVRFPLTVTLDPGQTARKNLEILVPLDESAGTYHVFVKGVSTGERVYSVEKGTYDVLELFINVEVRSVGNIVFATDDTSRRVIPGIECDGDYRDASDLNPDPLKRRLCQCTFFDVSVLKNFQSDFIQFSLPGYNEYNATEDGDLATWKHDNWEVTVDFTRAPNPENLVEWDEDDLGAPRLWEVSQTHPVRVIICAAENATARFTFSQMIKGNLVGEPRIADSVVLAATAEQVYHLESKLGENDATVLERGYPPIPLIVSSEMIESESGYSVEINPGRGLELPFMITNLGNGADRWDLRLDGITSKTVDNNGNTKTENYFWEVQLNNSKRESLKRFETANRIVEIDVPYNALKGDYVVTFSLLSNSKIEQRQIPIKVTVLEYHDLRICPQFTLKATLLAEMGCDEAGVIDATVESSIKETSPGKTVRFVFNVSNYGNVEDLMSFGFHTRFPNGTMNPVSTPATLATFTDGEVWEIEWNERRWITVDRFVDDELSVDAERGEYVINEPLQPFNSMTIVAVVTVAPDAVLTDRSVGLKVESVGDDFDETASWSGEDLDSNELEVEIRLRAPDIEVITATAVEPVKDVGDTIIILVRLKNDGNTRADEVDVILCVDESLEDIEEDGCDEDNIADRELVPVMTPQPNQGDFTEIQMLYNVEAGVHDGFIIVDQDNIIIEANENNNIMPLEEELSSSNPSLNVAAQIVSDVAMPVSVALLLGILGVIAFLVGSGRRKQALDRAEEQSSLRAGMAE